MDTDKWKEDRDSDGKVVFSFSIHDDEGKDIYLITCDWCKTEIPDAEGRYRCMECPSSHVCKECHEKGKKCSKVKYHLLNLEYEHPVWLHIGVRGSNPAESLVNAFNIYRNRPFIGSRFLSPMTTSTKKRKLEENNSEKKVTEHLKSALGKKWSPIYTHDEHPKDSYAYLSYSDVKVLTFKMAIAFKRLELSTVGLLCHNSLEWLITDFACCINGQMTVGLHQYWSKETLENVIEESGIEAIVCDPYGYQILSKIHCKSLRHIIRTESDFWEILCTEEYDEIKPEANPKSKFSLLYTSGTSGTPKGAIIEHNTWNIDIDRPVYLFPMVEYAYLPFSHGSGLLTAWISLSNGGRLGLASSNDPMHSVFSDCPLLQPTLFLAPPSFWSVLHDEFRRKIRPNLDPVIQAKCEREIYDGISSMMGDRIQHIDIGMSTVPDYLPVFLRKCFRCDVNEGYGMTEAGGITRNGVIAAGVSVKLLPVPEYGLSPTDKPYPRGQICVRTRVLFPGYQGTDPSESFTEDGYFITGDLGELRGENELKIIDRISNCVKMGNGLWVSLGSLETKFCLHCPSVDKIFLDGGDENLALVAVVVTKENKSVIQKEIQKASKLMDLSSQEIPIDIIIERQDWTPENGLMTISGKMVRGKLKKRYRSLVVKALETREMVDSAQDNEKEEEEIEKISSLSVIAKLFSTMIPGLDESTITSSKHLTFHEFGGNSLQAMGLSLRLIDLYRIDSFATGTFLLQQSVERLCELLDKGITREEVKKSRFEKKNLLESIMEHDLAEYSKKLAMVGNRSGKRDGNTILLTGATGFVGSFLLKELVIGFPGKRIVAIVRGNDSQTNAKDRLVSILKGYGIWEESMRFEVVIGDIGSDRMGLAEEKYEELAMSCSTIYHAAAKVDMTLSYESLKQDNVEGTFNVLTFAKQCSNQVVFHHISTLSAIAEGENELARFSLQSLVSQFEGDGYSQSKGMAENLVIECCRSNSIEFTIYRLGLVGWSIENGSYNQNDWLVRLIHSIHSTRVAPFVSHSKPCIAISPVDCMAKTLVHLSLRGKSGIFHLNPLKTISFSRIFEICQDHYKLEARLPFDEWAGLISDKDAGWPIIKTMLEKGLPTSICSGGFESLNIPNEEKYLQKLLIKFETK